MLSSDSPGTLSLSLFAKITKLPSFLVTLQALSLSFAKVTKLLTHNQITHATQLQHTLTCSSVVITYFSRLPPLPRTHLSSTSGKSITQQWVTGISTLQ